MAIVGGLFFGCGYGLQNTSKASDIVVAEASVMAPTMYERYDNGTCLVDVNDSGCLAEDAISLLFIPNETFIGELDNT